MHPNDKMGKSSQQMWVNLIFETKKTCYPVRLKLLTFDYHVTNSIAWLFHGFLADSNIGIKNDFPFINIRKVRREVLKTEGEARGFQHLLRDQMRMLMYDKIMFDRSYCINSMTTHRKSRKCLRTLFFTLTTIFLRVHIFYKYPWFGPWPRTFSSVDLKA